MDCAPGGPASQKKPACAALHPCLSDGNHTRKRITQVAVDLAVLDDQLALTELADDMHVVRGNDDCDANILKSTEQPHDLQRKVRIEVAGRLVGDEQRRLADNGARYSDTLLLSNR